jgi:hypothetical protein
MRYRAHGRQLDPTPPKRPDRVEAYTSVMRDRWSSAHPGAPGKGEGYGVVMGDGRRPMANPSGGES